MIRRCIGGIGPLIVWTALSLLGNSSFAQSIGQQCDPQGQSGGCCLPNGTYAPAGAPCNDGNPRTIDSCNATGICVGVYPQPLTCASGGTYNQQTGACVANSRPSPMCGDGNVDPGEQCDSGSKCNDGADCTGNPDVCGDGSCHAAAGNCCTASCTFASAGTGCDDGNGCTPTDTCDGSGTCVGSGQVDCNGSDACHPTNFCTPATGSCSTCRDPNNVQDQSYCSLDTGQCVSNVQACPQYEIDAQGNQNLCHTNSGRDPNTGECIYQPKLCAPIPGDCNIQQCQPSTGQCVEIHDPNCIGQCNEPTFPDTPCFSGTCLAEGCSFDPNGLPNCNLVETSDCPYDHNSCVYSKGCAEGVGCVFSAVSCDLPTNPCQEVVRTPEASTCCTYQERNCAAEFNNNPNYIYTCDPTPGTGGCRAFIPQTITFNTPGPQAVGTTLNLVASASSGLPVSFGSKTPVVCTVSGNTANLLTTGSCEIEATQPGGTAQPGKTPYAAATPVDVNFLVQLRPQTITFKPIAQQVVGAKITLTATATSGLPVTFSSLTPTICSVSGNSATMGAQGTCEIEASQAGNSYYAAAQSVTQSFNVVPAANFTITPNPSAETVPRGNLAAFILTLKSLNGFNGNVKLSCSGGPAGSYCADFPMTVHLNGTAGAISGILFPKNTKPGAYTITFTGVSGPLTNSTHATFTVK